MFRINMLGEKDLLINYSSFFLADGRPGNSTSRSLNLLNLTGQPTVPAPAEFSNGIVFFTRPDLNLQDRNLLSDKTTALRSLLAKPDSYLKHIRMALSPYHVDKDGAIGKFATMDTPFIHLLSNQVATLDGFPDKTITPKTTNPSKTGSTRSYAAGVKGHDGDFTLNSTFKNIIGDPIRSMFDIWIEYIHHSTVTGLVVPLPQNVAFDRIDYTTRIFYFVLNKSRTKVAHAFMTGTAFPTISSLGELGSYERDKKIKDEEIAEVSQTWQCNHLYYNEFDIIFRSFNKLVTLFDPMMADGRRESNYTKLPKKDVERFGDFGKPRLDITTGEFQIWVRNDLYETLKLNESEIR